MSTPTIDYDALAKQYGATSSQIDYDALAKQHGAISSSSPEPTEYEKERLPENRPGFFKEFGKTIGGIAKGALSVPEGYFNPAGAGIAAGAQIGAEDVSRQIEGRSTPYRAVAAAGSMLGINARGMEEAANVGSTPGVLGAAAGSAAPLAVAPIVRGVTRAVRSYPPLETGAELVGKIVGRRGTARMAEVPAHQEAGGPYTRSEINQFAAEKGIDLLPGQASELRPVQTLQSLGERSIMQGGEALQQRLEQQHSNFVRAGVDLQNKVSPEVAGTEAVGNTVKQQAVQKLADLKAAAKQDFETFRQATGDVPVDLSPLKAKYAERLAQNQEALRNLPQRYAAPVKSLLQKLSDVGGGDPALEARFQEAMQSYGLGPDMAAQLRTQMGLPAEPGAKVTMSTAQQLRSAYLDIAQDYSGNVPKRVQAIASEAAKDIDGAMDTAAKSAGVDQVWRQANARWKQLQQVYNDSSSPLYHVLQETDPSRVPQKLIAAGNIGGSPQTIRILKQQGIDVGPLKREVIDNIANKNFSFTQGGRRLGGYSTEFLKTLFEPNELAELQKLARVGRAIRFEMNPSGTSNVMLGESQFRGILHGKPGLVLPEALAARLSLSEAFKRGVLGRQSPGTDLPAGSPTPFNLPSVSGGSPTAGTASGAAQDTAFFAQAKQEMPNASVSDQLRRAQQLKTQAVPAGEDVIEQTRRRGIGTETPVPPKAAEKPRPYESQSSSGPTEPSSPYGNLVANARGAAKLYHNPKTGEYTLVDTEGNATPVVQTGLDRLLQNSKLKRDPKTGRLIKE